MVKSNEQETLLKVAVDIWNRSLDETVHIKRKQKMKMIYTIFKLIIQTMAKAGEMEATAYRIASKSLLLSKRDWSYQEILLIQ